MSGGAALTHSLSRPTLPSLRSLPLSALLHPAWEAARPSTRASGLGTHRAHTALTSLPSPTHKHRRPTQCCRSTRAQSQQLFNDVMCRTSEGAQAKGKRVGVCVGRPVRGSMRALADFDIKMFYVHLQFDYCQDMACNRVQINRCKLFLDTVSFNMQ